MKLKKRTKPPVSVPTGDRAIDDYFQFSSFLDKQAAELKESGANDFLINHVQRSSILRKTAQQNQQ